MSAGCSELFHKLYKGERKCRRRKERGDGATVQPPARARFSHPPEGRPCAAISPWPALNIRECVHPSRRPRPNLAGAVSLWRRRRPSPPAEPPNAHGCSQESRAHRAWIVAAGAGACSLVANRHVTARRGPARDRKVTEGSSDARRRGGCRCPRGQCGLSSGPRRFRGHAGRSRR